MFKHILAAVLVSVVSGCVTADGSGPYTQSVARSARTQQAAQAAGTEARRPQTTPSQVILGAAY
jgi:hypothetical protein